MKLYQLYSIFVLLGGRKRAKDTKVLAKKKRRTASSEEETRAETTGAKAPKTNKKQKVNHEKEVRKNQKVIIFIHILTNAH